MAHSVDLTAESSARVEQVHAVLGDERYWRDRLAVNDSGPVSLDSLNVAADGTVTVVMTLNPLRDHLPKLITRWHRGHLEIRHTETWSPTGGGRLRGTIRFAVSGAPLSGSGAVLLTPLRSPDDGSRLQYTATVQVGIPAVGGTIERFIGGQLPDGILEAQRFTADWIQNSRVHNPTASRRQGRELQ